MSSQKNELRTQLRSIRASIGAEQRLNAAQKISEHFLNSITCPENTVIAGYVAIDHEADVGVLLDNLADQEYEICLPVVETKDNPLVFRRWRPGTELIEGAHGTLCPQPHSPALTPDIVLVPLVAFDATGNRLGFGAGYYDRTLAVLRAQGDVQVIGIGYADQQCDMLPCEAHDQKLDAVVTENEVLSF